MRRRGAIVFLGGSGRIRARWWINRPAGMSRGVSLLAEDDLKTPSMSGVPMTTTETTIGINGMAHVILTVSQFPAARAFYGRLLPALGMTPVCDTDKLFYCVGARTAIGIQPAGPAHNGDRFLQSRVGLHHLCLRARSREDVDRLHDLLRQMGAIIIHGPQEGTWAPGYYSVLFEDPDGIRLEANFVPGAGVLQPDVKFNPAEGYST
jgi:catechol 2,3-dioxygenase-like lactoylglutathione lyase family enzyme